MIDDELRALLAQPPDRPLDALQADIWAGLAERQRRTRFTTRLLLLQAAVLLVALAGSALAGMRWSHAAYPGPLDAFSPRMALSVSTRLTGVHP